MSILLAAIVIAGSATDSTWCASPRSPEPLMADAIRLGTSTSTDAEHDRVRMNISPVPRDSIQFVHDETVCRQAAAAYWAVLRRWVPDQFGDQPDTPVLVIALGSVLLVDDQRSRDAYWEVMVFDGAWQRLYGYGGGS